VGAGLIHIVPRLQDPQPALGLTLSPIQARLAGQFVKQANLDTHIGIAEGDFMSVPLAAEALDAIYSVEAVVHAPEPERYFQEASRLLRRGGKLILVDDYRAARALTQHETKWLEAYIQGWHAPGVTTVAQAVEFAGRFGLRLTKNEDFTPHLHLRTLPNPVANTLLLLGRHLPVHHPILPSMLGSMALQQCLSMQVIEYRMLVFAKNGG
jgi:tocopherol O-methyltransferase